MNHKDSSHRLTLRLLAALLSYPDADLRQALPGCVSAIKAIEDMRALPSGRVRELIALMTQLQIMDPYAAEARYVETFDRGRKTSLHLFEHVHGDSRERGPALIDLRQTYEQAGLNLSAHELPDYLPAVLEFASTQPRETARAFLAEMAHILNAIFTALIERDSPYASVLAAVLELAGEQAHAVPLAEELPLDDAWAEPPAFDGCSSRGQAKPGAEQPIHFVRAREGAAPRQGGRV